MSYAGHVLDMMKRMKANRAMQKKRRSAFQERATKLVKEGSSYNEETAVLNELSDAEKMAIRERLAIQLAKDRKKDLIINSILILILLFFRLYSEEVLGAKNNGFFIQPRNARSLIAKAIKART